MLCVLLFSALVARWAVDEELNHLEGGPAIAPGPFFGDPDDAS